MVPSPSNASESIPSNIPEKDSASDPAEREYQRKQQRDIARTKQSLGPIETRSADKTPSQKTKSEAETATDSSKKEKDESQKTRPKTKKEKQKRLQEIRKQIRELKKADKQAKKLDGLLFFYYAAIGKWFAGLLSGTLLAVIPNIPMIFYVWGKFIPVQEAEAQKILKKKALKTTLIECVPFVTLFPFWAFMPRDVRKTLQEQKRKKAGKSTIQELRKEEMELTREIEENP